MLAYSRACDGGADLARGGGAAVVCVAAALCVGNAAVTAFARDVRLVSARSDGVRRPWLCPQSAVDAAASHWLQCSAEARGAGGGTPGTVV